MHAATCAVDRAHFRITYGLSTPSQRILANQCDAERLFLSMGVFLTPAGVHCPTVTVDGKLIRRRRGSVQDVARFAADDRKTDPRCGVIGGIVDPNPLRATVAFLSRLKSQGQVAAAVALIAARCECVIYGVVRVNLGPFRF